MRHALVAVTLAFTALFGGSAMAQMLPFEGKWALQADKCGVAADSTEAGPPIVLSAKRLVAAPFMTCDFSSVQPGGISFRVEAACDAAGQKGREFFTFAVLNGRLYWSWGARPRNSRAARIRPGPALPPSPGRDHGSSF